MLKAKKQVCLALLSTLMVTSCQSVQTGTIKFEFDKTKISFVDPSYNSYELKGQSGTKIENGLPDVKQEGYYFVGWREKDSNGNYRAISQLKDESTNETYYCYPYGTDILYPYFEKEVKITFDCGVNGKLVAPTNLSNDYTASIYSGYTNKVIYSTNFLPTASKENSRFQYWYTTKKIVKVNNTEGGGYHYALDESSEDGIYQFDKAFGTDNMTFLDSDFTLYAYYEDNPYVTLNFGITGINDYTFQAYDESIETKLREAIKSTLNVDYTDDALYYPANNPTKKLSGIYLDQEYTKSTSLDIKVSNSDLNLYMRWNDRTTVTLDFNGGNYNGETTKVLDNYYIDDVVSKSDLDNYVPTKENATFVGWKLEDGTTVTPDHTTVTKNMVIKAIFDDNPVLNVTYIYPVGYSKSSKTVTTEKFKAGENVKSYILSLMDDSLLSEGEHYNGLYQATNNTESSSLNEKNYVAVTSPYMSSTTTNYYISVAVDEKVTLKTIKDGTVESAETSKYFSKTDTVKLEEFGLGLDQDDGDLIYDGLYQDQACTKKIVSNRTGSTYDLTDSKNKYYKGDSTVYRKMTTGVMFTFKNLSGEEIGSATFIPGKRVSDNDVKSRMLSKFNITYTNFYEDENASKEITTIPTTSKTIYVK